MCSGFSSPRVALPPRCPLVVGRIWSNSSRVGDMSICLDFIDMLSLSVDTDDMSAGSADVSVRTKLAFGQ